MQAFFLLLIGLAAGFMGGLFGVGGGIIMVPLLVLAMGLTQQQAQGVSLAVILLPTALPAVWRYWKAGNLELGAAFMVSAGFLAGGWFGGGLAQQVPAEDLKRWFGVFCIAAGIRLVFWK